MLVSDLFVCPIGGQHLSCCFHDVLIQRSLPANSTVHCTCLAHTGVIPREIENDIFLGGWGGGKQSTRRCANNKSMKLILFSPSHCFPWFFNIVLLLPKNSHDSKTYFNLKSGTKVFCRLSLRLPLQCFI